MPYIVNRSSADNAGGATALTLHDTNELAPYARALYIGGAGNLKVTTADGSVVTFNGLTAGSVLPVRTKIAWATGSTATNVVALW
jgi:hypothetical protein